MPSINNVSNQLTTNIVPVQGTFDQNGNVINLIGPAGKIIPSAIFSLDANGNPIGMVNPKDGSSSYLSKKLLRIKSSLSSALAERIWTKSPIVAPPAWSALTTYFGGNVVSSGGVSYMALVDNGTTGVTLPTFSTVGASVTDGTQKWVQYKSPVVDISLNTMAATPYTWGTAEALNSVSIPVVTGGAVDPRFFVTGGALSVSGSNIVAQAGKATNGTFVSSTTCQEFFTDSQSLTIGQGNNTYAKTTVKVDGQPLILGQLSGTALYQSLNLYFGTRKIRKVKISSGTSANGSSGATAVSILPNSRIWATENPNRYRIVWSSNSYYVSCGYPDFSTPAQIATRLGCDDLVNVSVGGDGFVTVGQGQTYEARMANVVSLTPDIYVVGDAYNDTAGTTLQTTIYNHLVTARAALPNVVILLIGSNSANSGTGIVAQEANTLAAYNAYITAFPSDKLIAYVPQSVTATSQFMFGTGRIDNQVGNGNSDYYTANGDFHPWQLGVDYLADRLHNAILGALNGIFNTNGV